MRCEEVPVLVLEELVMALRLEGFALGSLDQHVLVQVGHFLG